jgi:GAF domain-containing protein
MNVRDFDLPAGGMRLESLASIAGQDALRPLEAVQRMTAAMYEASSLQAVYEEAVTAVVTAIGVDRVSLLLFDPDGVMRFKAWRGLSTACREAVEEQTPWSPSDIGATTTLVPDVAADPELAGLAPSFRSEGIAALAFVPLIQEQRVVGTFMLCHDQPHRFSTTEVAVSEIVAAQVALALQRRRQEEAERSVRQEAEILAARLASLQRVTADLSGAATLGDVVEVVLGTALREFGATSGSLCLRDGDDLEIAYAVGYPDDVLQHWRRFPLAADLPASDVVRTGEPLFFSTPEERDARYPIFATTPVVGDDAFAVVPLIVREPIGSLVLGFAEPRVFTAQDREFFLLLAARCAPALVRGRLFDERERAVAAETAARRLAEQSRNRIAFLAQASQVLASSLDNERTLTQVAELTVPKLADWCGIYLSRPGGGIEPVAVTHVDPSRVRLVREMLEQNPPKPTDAGGIAAVIRTGNPEFYPEITDEMLVAGAIDEEQLELARRLDIGSAMVVPLRARGRVFGAFSLANERGRPMDPDDLFLAEELAARAAMAIDNATLYEERAYVARSLQAGLLPPELPDIPGVELAARYLPASYEVGGDFYDIFRIGSGPWLLAVGDVCGKGPVAAAVTGLIRSAVRTAALRESDPAGILQLVNQSMLSQLDTPSLFTMVVAAFERAPSSIRVTTACAGHPLPLVVRRDGVVEAVTTGGMLLGVFPEPALAERTLVLGPDDAYVVFTDGAIDPRNGGHADAIASAVRGSAGTPPTALVDAVVAAATSGEAVDDIAVLALRMRGEG